MALAAKAARNTSLSFAGGCKCHPWLMGIRLNGWISNEVCSCGMWCFPTTFRVIRAHHAQPDSALSPPQPPAALAARGCWGCLRKGCFGTLKPSSESLSPSLSHGNDIWKMHLFSIYYRPVNELFPKLYLKYITVPFPITCMNATVWSCKSLAWCPGKYPPEYQILFLSVFQEQQSERCQLRAEVVQQQLKTKKGKVRKCTRANTEGNMENVWFLTT